MAATTYAGQTALGVAKMTPPGRVASLASRFVPSSVKNAAKDQAQRMKNAAMVRAQTMKNTAIRRFTPTPFSPPPSQGGQRTRKHKNKRHTRRN